MTSIDTEPPDTSRGVFHISGKVDDPPETARTEEEEKVKKDSRVRSPKMSAKPASTSKKSVGRGSKVSAAKIKKIGLVGPAVLLGKKSSRPSRDSSDRTNERTSVTSTSSRIDQAKTDHFNSQGSPAVLNLNQVMDGGIDNPAMDYMEM